MAHWEYLEEKQTSRIEELQDHLRVKPIFDWGDDNKIDPVESLDHNFSFTELKQPNVDSQRDNVECETVRNDSKNHTSKPPKTTFSFYDMVGNKINTLSEGLKKFFNIGKTVGSCILDTSKSFIGGKVSEGCVSSSLVTKSKRSVETSKDKLNNEDTANITLKLSYDKLINSTLNLNKTIVEKCNYENSKESKFNVQSTLQLFTLCEAANMYIYDFELENFQLYSLKEKYLAQSMIDCLLNSIDELSIRIRKCSSMKDLGILNNKLEEIYDLLNLRNEQHNIKPLAFNNKTDVDNFSDKNLETYDVLFQLIVENIEPDYCAFLEKISIKEHSDIIIVLDELMEKLEDICYGYMDIQLRLGLIPSFFKSIKDCTMEIIEKHSMFINAGGVNNLVSEYRVILLQIQHVLDSLSSGSKELENYLQGITDGNVVFSLNSITNNLHNVFEIFLGNNEIEQPIHENTIIKKTHKRLKSDPNYTKDHFHKKPKLKAHTTKALSKVKGSGLMANNLRNKIICEGMIDDYVSSQVFCTEKDRSNYFKRFYARKEKKTLPGQMS